MRHPTEDDLVLFYYGETRDAAIRAHLDACETCRARYGRLHQMLSAIVTEPIPARGEEYGAEVWRRLRPRLPDEPASPWAGVWHAVRPRRLALAGGLAALVLAAFVAGRFWPRPMTQTAQPLTAEVRERILLAAVGDHLERSQMVLVELMNAGHGDAIDISTEQKQAAELAAANRLYRQTATRAGEAALASVLDDLERVLLEVANSPSNPTPTELDDTRRRIEVHGLLFKVRILERDVRRREQRRASDPAGRSL